MAQLLGRDFCKASVHDRGFMQGDHAQMGIFGCEIIISRTLRCSIFSRAVGESGGKEFKGKYKFVLKFCLHG